MIENMFENATRNKIRFDSGKGLIGVEDLWDLPVKKLDLIYQELDEKLERTNRRSLLEVKSAEDEAFETQMEIVKHIVRVKQAEAKAKLDEKEKSEKKQRIMEILKNKQDESLQNLSEDKLKEMLEKL